MILVTGATGYIGRYLVARLVAQEEPPRCLVRNINRAANILPAGKIEFVKGDTTSPATLETAVQGIDTTMHTAFITADHKQSTSNQYEATNVQGTANLIKVAKKAGVKRIIVLSGLGTRPDQPASDMQGRYLTQQRSKDS